jgi:hypothetical protein
LSRQHKNFTIEELKFFPCLSPQNRIRGVKRVEKNDETKWLRKAQEAIKIAESMKDEATRREMFIIASSYEALAKLAREQAVLRKSGGEDQGGNGDAAPV